MGQFDTTSFSAVGDLPRILHDTDLAGSLPSRHSRNRLDPIQDRLQTAKSEIRKRQHVFSMDHGGTPEERQAITDALHGMEGLRAEVAEWQNRVKSGDAATASD
jgi:hypothetical protein